MRHALTAAVVMLTICGGGIGGGGISKGAISGAAMAQTAPLPAASEISATVFEGRYHLSGSLGGGLGGALADLVVIGSSASGFPLELSTCVEGKPRLFGRLLPGAHPNVPNALRGQFGPMPVWCAYEAQAGQVALTCATDGQGRVDLRPDTSGATPGC